ncbi:MAG: SurA N-terminal domain-containing protein [Treponema sp.]|nr:SurA N-terminal domain-containing protein [Treponema sp.]
MAKAKKTHAAEEPGVSEIINRFKEHPFLFSGSVLILVIIIIAFVFLPSGPSITGRQETVFGYYNGKAITDNRYFRQALQENYYNMNSDNTFQAEYQAFISTVIHTAILDEMKRAGYQAPSEEINRQVSSLPVFQDEGLFSIVKYNNYDKNELLALWRSTEENYITGKYYNAMMELKVSSAEKDFIGAMAYPERRFELISIPRTAYPDSEVSAFAAANPDLFMNVHLSRITLSSEKEAQQLLDSVKNGKTFFEDAARGHSIDKDKDRDGDMGIRMAHEIFTDLEETDRAVVTSLRMGDLSPLLKTPAGTWIFFRAEETPYEADLSQEENLTKVRNYMNNFEGGRIENWLVALAEEFLEEAQAQGTSLFTYVESLKGRGGVSERFASLEKVNTGVFGPTNLNYGDMGWYQLFANTLNAEDNPELADALTNEVFWRSAFFTPLNTSSAPFTLGGSIVLLTPVEETLEDEDSVGYIPNFYAGGWMVNTIQMDMNGAIMSSEKFENRFLDVLLSRQSSSPDNEW